MSDAEIMLRDVAGLTLGIAVAVALWIPAGALMAKAMERLCREGSWRGWALPLAVSILPVVDSLCIRVGGVWPAVALHLVLTVVAFAVARDHFPRLTRTRVAALTVWVVVLAFVYVDVAWDGQLFQSLLVVDLVKHAVVVRQIGLEGVPFADPYFLRDGPAGYYHYFYGGAALVDLSGGEIVDARMAFVSSTFVAGLSMAALVRAVVVELGWQHASDDRLDRLVIAVCSIAGFDLVGMGLVHGLTGRWESNLEWWSDEISLMPTTATWVPHHLTAVVAAWVAFVLVIRIRSVQARSPAGVALCAVSGIAMASAFGLSVWVTLGACAILVVAALVSLSAGRGPSQLMATFAAGTLALAMSAWQIRDLLGRQDAGSPMALRINDAFGLDGLLAGGVPWWLSVVLTPFDWFLELGFLVIGAALFLVSRGMYARSFLSQVLLASTVLGLLLNLVLQSVVINNDFGWRVAWFAALPMMVWTIAVWQALPVSLPIRLLFYGAVVIGLSGTAHNVVMSRFHASVDRGEFAYLNQDPSMDYQLARAYRWGTRHLPADAVLQHDPSVEPRAFGFGLYGLQRTGVADAEANLFGAAPRDVARRVDRWESVFSGGVLPQGPRGWRLVVTSRSPLWKGLTSDSCVYRSTDVCITHSL